MSTAQQLNSNQCRKQASRIIRLARQIIKAENKKGTKLRKSIRPDDWSDDVPSVSSLRTPYNPDTPSKPSTHVVPDVDWSICYYALIADDDLELSISYNRDLMEIIHPLEISGCMPTRSYNLTAAEHRSSLLKHAGITCKLLTNKKKQQAYVYSQRFKWGKVYAMTTINRKVKTQYVVFWESATKPIDTVEENV